MRAPNKNVKYVAVYNIKNVVVTFPIDFTCNVVYRNKNITEIKFN